MKSRCSRKNKMAVSKPPLRIPASLCAARAKARGQHFYSSSDILKSSLIELRIFSVGILDFPVFHSVPFGAREGMLFLVAAHIDYQVGGSPFASENGFGVERVGGIAIAAQRFKGQLLHHAEGRQTGAAGFE